MLDILLTKRKKGYIIGTIAFPGGTGTDNMVKISKYENVNTWRLLMLDGAGLTRLEVFQRELRELQRLGEKNASLMEYFEDEIKTAEEKKLK
jgi:hypothetical protein